MDTYTLEQVARHDGNSGEGVWIVIKNIVYDVTEYLNEHPGGGELITEYAGRDATAGFNDFGHSSDALKLLKLYKIGYIAEKHVSKVGQGENDGDAMAMNTSKRKARRLFFPLFRSCA